MSEFLNTTNLFRLKAVKIKGYEILPQAIHEWNIYESILSPAIMGDISIADWQGFNEVGEIFALDPIQFTFVTQDRKELQLTYYIYSGVSNVIPMSTYIPITYSFCSRWFIDAFTRSISKTYDNMFIHDIIKDLLFDCGATVNFIEPIKQKLHHFTSPLWTPIKTIQHLLSFSMNTSDKGGYVFWSDIDNKINICTLDYLFSGKYGKEDNKYIPFPDNESYESRIINLSLENNFDVMKYSNMGIGRTIYQGYYKDKNKLVSSDVAINEFPYTHLSKKLPINNIFKDKKYASIKGCYLYPSKKSLVSDDNDVKNMIEGKAKTHYARLFADVLKINIITNPNNDRRVGNLAEVEYLSSDKSKITQNKQLSGTYLQQAIRHMGFNTQYNAVVSLIRDGYNNSENDLITW